MLTRSLICAALAEREQPQRRGDYDLNPEHRSKQSARPLQPAAVLLPLVERADGFHLILTQRTDHLHHHPGQICLPGGRYDATDQSLMDTALRETEEEIGLHRQFIEVAGYLDSYETATGFLIVPIIGFVRTGFQLTLDSFEVADAFEVPLSFIVEPRHYEQVRMQHADYSRVHYVLQYQQRHIWGATAGILMNFYQRLQKAGLEKTAATSALNEAS